MSKSGDFQMEYDGKNNPIKILLVKQANEDHKTQPQYAGHWDGDEWVPMIAKRTVKRWGMVDLTKDKVYLVNVESVVTLTAKDTDKPENVGKAFVTVYRPESMCDTSMRLDYFKPIS